MGAAAKSEAGKGKTDGNSLVLPAAAAVGVLALGAVMQWYNSSMQPSSSLDPLYGFREVASEVFSVAGPGIGTAVALGSFWLSAKNWGKNDILVGTGVAGMAAGGWLIAQPMFASPVLGPSFA